MSPRRAVLPGVVVAALGFLVLAGWAFDIAAAKSVMAGWRVMVPATAMSLMLAGIAIVLAAKIGSHDRRIAFVRACGCAALILPLLTLVEYFTGVRTGIENWFGIAFDPSSEFAGRMSPLTAICFTALSLSIIAATIPGGEGVQTFALTASGATLLTAWLAIVTVAFDAGRLADVPRFPGMAILTILMVAFASWAALTLSLDRDGPDAGGTPAHAGLLLVIAFAVPLALGWIRETTATRVSPQLLTSLLVFILTVVLVTVVRRYSSSVNLLRRERERAVVELERRVGERTGELAARNDLLRRSEDRLLDADRRKDEFLATLAHELRNPLAPIRNAVALLRSPRASEEDKGQARLIIDRQVTHMVRLIDDLLDVSRIATGKLPLHRARLQLSDVLEMAIATARPHIDHARHRLTVSMPDESITIDGDESRLAQVFANLLHNACKYTEPGGDISLKVIVQQEEVAISVRDNGIGIPPEFLPRLFEKFSQVAPALDRSQGGLGLGLALVRGIVRRHDGHVEARSDGPGRGSEFVVMLPVVAVAESRRSHEHAPDAARVRVSRRVLVVDDNADSVQSMAQVLRSEGHTVETAFDGEAALALAERFHPDAILLDLGMPKLNGFEVCRAIRKRSWGASVLVVAQTGWGQDQDRARTLEAGFDAHLTKPVDLDVVHDLLAGAKRIGV